MDSGKDCVPDSDVRDELRRAARQLQKAAQAGHPRALERLRALPELRAQEDSALRELVRRRHGLAAIARELGFHGWSHLVAVLEGREAEDFGSLLCPTRCAVHWNIWSADLGEALALREESGGYLLAYRRQFLIVDRHYLMTLGLEPEDPDWECIGRNWPRPLDAAARARLYGKLIRFEREGGREGGV